MFRQPFQTAALICIIAVPTYAADLPAPQEDVVLTVSGPLEVTNVENTAQFDMEMLQSLDNTTFETRTIWTEGKHLFEGVSLFKLVEHLGIEGESLRATAINDYAVEIPLEDAVEEGPIIAYKMDGEVMSLRDKGPLWIVYPFDNNPNYNTEVTYARSIWQLDRIEVLD
ncbi:molybdopterin-dependent oxidoreductase [Rhodobacteraceae bacterium R_SAG2]|nr:molybdopterin-dependent oxidoreductase [Rhodobacteraceae bacterium R_SAG2]